MPLSPGAVPKATAVGKPPSPCAKQSSETSLNMDITFRTGAVHGVSLREVGAIDRCRKVPLGGHHYDAAKCKEFRRTRQPSADCKVKRDRPLDYRWPQSPRWIPHPGRLARP